MEFIEWLGGGSAILVFLIYIILAFSTICYVLLPIYLIWRLGKNSMNDKKRHKQLFAELRSIHRSLEQSQSGID